MGVVKNISFGSFPRQGDHLNKKAVVCFNYDTSKTIAGTIVRDDREYPFLTMIRLGDGRTVLASECQYSIQ